MLGMWVRVILIASNKFWVWPVGCPLGLGPACWWGSYSDTSALSNSGTHIPAPFLWSCELSEFDVSLSLIFRFLVASPLSALCLASVLFDP